MTENKTLKGLCAAFLALVMAGCASSADSGPGGTTDQSGLDWAEETSATFYEGTQRELPSDAPAPVSGKRVWVIQLTAKSPSAVAFANSTKEAGELLGWNVNIVDGLGTPTGWSNAIRQAIAAKADAIVLDLIVCEGLETPLKQARQAGIKIYGISGDCDSSSTPTEPLYDGQIYANYPNGFDGWVDDWGKAKAAWIIQQTEGKGRIVVANQTDYWPVRQKTEGFVKYIEEHCGGCEIYKADITLGDLGTDLGGIVSSALLKHPDANAVLFPYDSVVLLGGASAVQQSGRAKSLDIMGGECLQSVLDLIRAGNGANACLGDPYPWMGWAAVDALNRIFQGEKEVDSGIGLQLIDKDHNLPEEGESYDGTLDYQANYKKIWNVQ